MATCQCGVQLPGRRQKCGSCKVRPAGPAPAGLTPAGSPEGLHERGLALWTTLGQPLDTVPGQIALEACRTADRLDELDRVIQGKGVLNLLRFRVGSDWADDLIREISVTVTFSDVLAEARQQATSFSKLLSDVGAPAAPVVVRNTALDQLAARRAKQ